jgi:hypothetical protein
MIKVTVITETKTFTTVVDSYEVFGKAIQDREANKGLFLGGNLWVPDENVIACTIEVVPEPVEEDEDGTTEEVGN